jgi:hypothetical protein
MMQKRGENRMPCRSEKAELNLIQKKMVNLLGRWPGKMLGNTHSSIEKGLKVDELHHTLFSCDS